MTRPAALTFFLFLAVAVPRNEWMMHPAEQPPRRVLIMMAHPDDPEFVAGGTIARWRRDGAWIGYVICTGGDKGSEDRALPGDVLARIREAVDAGDPLLEAWLDEDSPHAAASMLRKGRRP